MSDHSNKNTPSCQFCIDNPEQDIKEMFISGQEKRIAQGEQPAKRAVFRKVHGIAHGEFQIKSDLPAEYKVGVFGQKDSYPVWVRFSSDTAPNATDLEATSGIGIKLYDVEGDKLLGDGTTQDFILQNHDVFFVDDAQAMCEFTRAGVVEADYDSYLKTHETTARILDEMAKKEASVLTTTFWSGLPYKLGNNRPVKYKLEPEQAVDGEPFDSSNYLAIDLERRLRNKEARYRFMVQFQQDGDPIDQATVRWEGPWIQLATLVLPTQDITTRGQAEYGENLAFNPWHSLAEHEPLGSLSAARKITYAASAATRHAANGISNNEPGTPRPAQFQTPAQDTCIVKAAIYPGIGVARVGNSPDEFFIGPEVDNPAPEAPGFYRDSQGALKRQAARFRVYGLNAKGEIIKELTAADADIEWSVHLANQKSAWYEFQLALDIPEAKDAPPSLRRNALISDRSSLVIDPGKRTIRGQNKSGNDYRFNTDHFMDIPEPVDLGEIRTDEQGRLLVLGGFGKSASYDKSPAITFGNNQGWHDDTSDGPVTAKVHYEGVDLTVDPAWIVVAPPNYGPQLKSVRTMWDLMRDVAIQNKMLACPARPSFTKDILPIFQRMTDLQWVNAGFASSFGWQGPFNFEEPQWLERMSSLDASYRGLRRTLYQQFRKYDRDGMSPIPWPYLYGDAMNLPPVSPRQHSVLTDTQMSMLEQWANGDFIDDYDPNAAPVSDLESLEPAEQAAMLDKAALDFCLADAFHPGCEMTWPVRDSRMYMSAFRFKHPKHANWKEPNYGPQLNEDVLSLPSGPLSAGQLPGGITRWMAVPWQTDTASCRSGYDKEFDPYIPSFWPARVPNQVMTKEAYEVVIDESQPLEKRKQAFSQRADWDYPLNTDKSYTYQINQMIANFDQMGVVEVREGPRDSSGFPSYVQVSDRNELITPPIGERTEDTDHKTQHSLSHGLDILEDLMESIADLSLIDKVHRLNKK